MTTFSQECLKIFGEKLDKNLNARKLMLKPTGKKDPEGDYMALWEALVVCASNISYKVKPGVSLQKQKFFIIRLIETCYDTTLPCREPFKVLNKDQDLVPIESPAIIIYDSIQSFLADYALTHEMSLNAVMAPGLNRNNVFILPEKLSTPAKNWVTWHKIVSFLP